VKFLDEVRDPLLGGRMGLLLCRIAMEDARSLQVPLPEIREVLLDSRSLLRRVRRRDLVQSVDHLLEELWLHCPWTIETGRPESDVAKQKPRPSSHYVRHRKSGHGDFVTRDGRLLAILESIDLMGTTDLPVLIVGESGTGKELIARAIHEVSPRCDRPFVPINCGAIPGELHESEFFGHLRGSFTGALADKIGLFEQAHGGTVFLDEIGEMQLQAQVKLLRILESGEIRRVGETRLRRVDVRIVAATNSDLEKQLEKDRFRRDLFYRVRCYEIHLPPLRERPGDILVIAEHFLREGNRGCSKQLRFTSEARRAMLEREWNGNVRELRYVVQKGVAHARLIDSRDVTTEMLGLDREDGRRDPFWRSPLRIHLPLEAPLDRYLEEVERRIVVQALEENSWNRTRAARSLGQISRTTLIGKMKRLGLFTDSRKNSGENQAIADESAASG
jgi:transcriptional regulator with GAF, ATPase, and Fis domain